MAAGKSETLNIKGFLADVRCNSQTDGPCTCGGEFRPMKKEETREILKCSISSYHIGVLPTDFEV